MLLFHAVNCRRLHLDGASETGYEEARLLLCVSVLACASLADNRTEVSGFFKTNFDIDLTKQFTARR